MFAQTFDPILSQKGFTTMELVVVLSIIVLMSTVGIGVYRMYSPSVIADQVERDFSVITRGLTDRWMEGTACSNTMPPACPISSPMGTAYSVGCLRNGYTASVNLPSDIAYMVKVPNKELTVIDASTLAITTSLPAPFVSDGGFEKKKVYGE